MPNLVVIGQMVRALLRSPHEKFDPLLPAFQGHWRSSKPTRIDPLSITSY